MEHVRYRCKGLSSLLSDGNESRCQPDERAFGNQDYVMLCVDPIFRARIDGSIRTRRYKQGFVFPFEAPEVFDPEYLWLVSESTALVASEYQYTVV